MDQPPSGADYPGRGRRQPCAQGHNRQAFGRNSAAKLSGFGGAREIRMRFPLKLALLAALAAGLGAGYLAYRLTRPYRGFSAPVFVEFAHGTSTAEMAS